MTDAMKKTYTVEAVLHITVPNVKADSKEAAEFAVSQIKDLYLIYGHRVEVLEVKEAESVQ